MVLSYDFSASWFEPLRKRYEAIYLCTWPRAVLQRDDRRRARSGIKESSLVYLGNDVRIFAQAVSELGDVGDSLCIIQRVL